MQAAGKFDSGYSWFVACCTFTVTFCTLGMIRSSGLLYVEIQNVYSASREEAAWPVGIAGMGLCFAGALNGVLVDFLPLRFILMVGCAFACSGLCLCFVAPSCLWFTIFFGVIYGSGIGLLVPCSILLMNQHFKKFRGLANGFVMAGDSLSLFLMPPYTAFLLDKYGLKGSCLTIGATFMHLFILILLMKSKSSLIVRNKPATEKTVFLPGAYGVDIKTDAESTSRTTTMDFNNGFFVDHDKSSYQDVKVINSNSRERNLEDDYHYSQAISNSALVANSNDKINENAFAERLKTSLVSFWTLAKNPMFIICSTCHFFYSFISIVYCIVIVDYGLDRGVPRSQAVYLITVTGLTELFGRVCIGGVTDRKLVSVKTVVMVNQLLCSFILAAQTMLGSVSFWHFAACGAFGLLSGCNNALVNTTYLEYIGFGLLSKAMSLKSLIVGSLSFMRPLLIGFCRDKYGTYDYLFYALSLLSLIFAMSWLLEPLFKSKTSESSVKTDNQASTQSK